MPSTAEISTSGAVLKIFNIQLEDEGTYECEAENIRGKDRHQARIYVQGRYFVLIFYKFTAIFILEKLVVHSDFNNSEVYYMMQNHEIFVLSN